MKRFRLEQEYPPYTDYESIREGDPIRRVTLVREKGKEDWAYLTMETFDPEGNTDPPQQRIPIDEAYALLETAKP